MVKNTYILFNMFRNSSSPIKNTTRPRNKVFKKVPKKKKNSRLRTKLPRKMRI